MRSRWRSSVAYRSTRWSNVRFVSSIIAEKRPLSGADPVGSQRSLGTSDVASESESRPRAVASRRDGESENVGGFGCRLGDRLDPLIDHHVTPPDVHPVADPLLGLEGLVDGRLLRKGDEMGTAALVVFEQTDDLEGLRPDRPYAHRVDDPLGAGEEDHCVAGRGSIDDDRVVLLDVGDR